MPAGTTGLTVTLTLHVDTAPGGALDDVAYTIEADDVPPIPGPPVHSPVTDAGAAPIPALSDLALALLALALAAGAVLRLRR